MTEIVSSSSSSQLAGRSRRRAGQELPVRILGIAGARAADHRDARQVQRRCQRLQPGIQQQVPRAAVGQDVPDLGAGQPVVNRDQDPASGRHAEMGLQHRRGVEQQRGHPVPLAQARRPQRVGQPPRPLGELPVGISPLAIDDRGLVRVQVRRPVQEVHRVQLRPEHLARHRPGPGRTGGRRVRACHCLSPSWLQVTAPLGCINTPGFMIPAGSSSALAPRSAAVNSCGTSRRYHRRWSRPTA